MTLRCPSGSGGGEKLKPISQELTNIALAAIEYLGSVKKSQKANKFIGYTSCHAACRLV
jgi:hypothetical protein